MRIDQANASRDVFVLSGDPGLAEVRYRVANDATGVVVEGDVVVSIDLAAYDMARAPEPQQLRVEAESLKDGIEILDRKSVV